MAVPGGRVIVLTGIMAAGKSTVAQALAECLTPSVHLRGDLFRRMIVNGQAPVTPENWEAAEVQLRLRQKLATDVAKTYADSGYSVCYQDVILGDDLGRVVAMLEPSVRPVHVVVLSHAPEIAAQRDEARNKTGYGSWTAVELDHSLRHETPRIGFWIDTSNLSVDKSVDAILAHLDDARI